MFPFWTLYVACPVGNVHITWCFKVWHSINTPARLERLQITRLFIDGTFYGNYYDFRPGNCYFELLITCGCIWWWLSISRVDDDETFMKIDDDVSSCSQNRNLSYNCLQTPLQTLAIILTCLVFKLITYFLNNATINKLE